MQAPREYDDQIVMDAEGLELGVIIHLVSRSHISAVHSVAIKELESGLVFHEGRGLVLFMRDIDGIYW